MAQATVTAVSLLQTPCIDDDQWTHVQSNLQDSSCNYPSMTLTALQVTQHSCSAASKVIVFVLCQLQGSCLLLQVSMVTVAQFIDSIEHLNANSKAALKRHVQMDEFGASLDADCDDLFKEALRENLPTTFNAL